uniref:Uncharacterized protein n=1 Tax=Plectus sambesii TaxID=2011161 RepID=A0A914V531_9BILA
MHQFQIDEEWEDDSRENEFSASLRRHLFSRAKHAWLSSGDQSPLAPPTTAPKASPSRLKSAHLFLVGSSPANVHLALTRVALYERCANTLPRRVVSLVYLSDRSLLCVYEFATKETPVRYCQHDSNRYRSAVYYPFRR